jgi:hypothetical protein
MKKDKPLFDPTTHYRIEVQGQVDVEWLQSFDSSVEIIVAETKQMERITVLNVHQIKRDRWVGAQAARTGNSDPAITDRFRRRKAAGSKSNARKSPSELGDFAIYMGHLLFGFQ